jgi:Flp pilus assembly protein TadG
MLNSFVPTRRNSRHRRRGQAVLIEFVVVAPILIVLGMGMIQLGILLSNIETLSSICRDTARLAARLGSKATTAQIISGMQADCANSSINYSDITWTVSYPNGNGSGKPVELKIQYDLRKKMWLPTGSSGGYTFPGMNAFNTPFGVQTTMIEES